MEDMRSKWTNRWQIELVVKWVCKGNVGQRLTIMQTDIQSWCPVVGA